MSQLVLILPDQLNLGISSLKEFDAKKDRILMVESSFEMRRPKHHQKKIAFLFSAMRHFAKELEKQGFRVEYVSLSKDKYVQEIEQKLKNSSFNKFLVMSPSDHYLLEEFQSLKIANCEIEITEDNRFLATQEFFENWAEGRKSLRMEYFYREMRKEHDILMNGDKPVGDVWNYDSENRKTPKDDIEIPKPYSGTEDEITKEVLALVEENFADHFGDLKPFYFATTRRQALNALENFIDNRLPKFGDFQDAMLQNEPWMFHSHLSFYLNCGLLMPMEVIEAAVEAFESKKAPINAVEGFVRQILGWREYVRGIYWLKMPNYAKENFLNAARSLPEFYWNGDSGMNCMDSCIKETKENAYAHHIQRLMVLGNFALIAGIAPEEVNEWYWIVYADAYEWVELPNVTGMILFADGGFLASKPYSAGGAYINKMSNYCKNCSYSVSQKTGEKACPFNYLYWDFLDRNRDKLKNNHRIAMLYKTLDKMSQEKYGAMKDSARDFLEGL